MGFGCLLLLVACRGRDSGSELAIPRVLETRIVEATTFAPCEPGAPERVSRLISCAAVSGDATVNARALPQAWEPNSPQRLAVTLVWNPRNSQLKRAAAKLESRAIENGQAEDWLALGAVEHARAQATDDPALLVDALEHTERGLARNPGAIWGLFNRAVILSELDLCRVASRAWSQYLEIDSASPWADEARERRRRLPCGQEELPAAATSHSDLPGSTDPRARFEGTLDELVPRWLEARAASSASEPELFGQIVAVGRQLAEDFAEPSVRELAREMQEADDLLLGAISQCLQGRPDYKNEDYPPARRAFDRAIPTLKRYRSRLWPWCELWSSTIETYEGNLSRAEERLTKLAESPAASDSPMLLGQIHWVAGLAAGRAGRLQTSFEHLAQADRIYLRAGLTYDSASVRVLKAEALGRLGWPRASWPDRHHAIRDLQGPRPGFFIHNALTDGAEVAWQTEAPEAARAFLDEAFLIAEESGDRYSQIEVLLARGELLHRIGVGEEALATYQRALAATSEFESGFLKDRFARFSRLGIAESSRSIDDQVEQLASIGRFFARHGPRFMQLRALSTRASRLREHGRRKEARRALDEALDVVRSQEADIRNSEYAVRFMDAAKHLFDQAISAAWNDGDARQALAYLERAREPGFEGTGPAQEGERWSSSPVDRAQALQSTPVIVAFGEVGERILWWRLDGPAIGSDSLATHRITGPIAKLGKERWRQPERWVLEELFDALLRPALAAVDEHRPLILVPDGLVATIPFAALRDSTTGDYLIDTRTVSLRTSVRRALMPPLVSGSSPERERWRAVVVGDPAFDQRILSWLQRLPAAAEEAREVAAIVGSSATLLVGEQATATAIRRYLNGSQVLHLAAHGLPGATPFEDRFALAAEPESRSSGLITSGELLADVHTLRLAVLSGCSTLGTTPSRSAGLLGLANSFVARGVSAVVATLWPMKDDLLAEMMTDFHRGLGEGLSASESLRRAQRVQAGERCCEWAGVQLIGDLPPAFEH